MRNDEEDPILVRNRQQERDSIDIPTSFIVEV